MKLGLILGITLFSLSACISSKDIELNNEEFLFKASYLADYYSLNIDTSGSSETAKLNRYIDGSYEFDYTYDLRDSERFMPLYYSLMVNKDNSLKDAKQTFSLTKGAILLTNKTIGLDVQVIDSVVFSYDEYYYALRTMDSEFNGIVFMAREGNYVYSFVSSGLYSTDHSIINDIVIPSLQEVETLLNNKGNV